MKYVTIIIALTALCFLACKNETKVDNSPTEKKDINSVYIKTVPIENVVEASQMNALGIIYSESEAKPSFKTGGIMAVSFLPWFLIMGVSAFLPASLNPVLDPMVTLAFGGIAFGLRYWLKQKYQLQGTMFMRR